MNVLYLTMNPNRTSTTVPTQGWFRFLSEKGLEPVLVSREIGDFHHFAKSLGIPSYQNSLPLPNKSNPFPFLMSLWRLRSITKKHKIELIHCNEQNIYPIGQYLARICKIPVVVSAHFTMNKSFCKWAFSDKKNPDMIFFLTKGSLNASRNGIENIIPKDCIRILYNGLDLEEFKPDKRLRENFRRQHSLSDEKIAIGVACALRPRKQLEHLFSAAAKIKNKNLQVFVAGDAIKEDKTYAKKLLQSAKEKLKDRLTLLGHLDDLKEFYNGIDIFINTSKEEACSISIIETLACGSPVLGYASKSVDEQILPSGGEVVEQDNIEELAIKLEEWISDKEKLKNRRKSARKRAEEVFDIRTISNSLWEHYLEITKKS